LSFVLEGEKHVAQKKLLDIKPDEHMVNCLREKEPASVARGRLIIDPSEKVFVQEVEQSEGCKRKAIDDRSYDGIRERDHSQ
jgi:hypothetical protein